RARFPVLGCRRLVDHAGIYHQGREPALVAWTHSRDPVDHPGILDERSVLLATGLHAARLRGDLGADARHHRHRPRLSDTQPGRGRLSRSSTRASAPGGSMAPAGPGPDRPLPQRGELLPPALAATELGASARGAGLVKP